MNKEVVFRSQFSSEEIDELLEMAAAFRGLTHNGAVVAAPSEIKSLIEGSRKIEDVSRRDLLGIYFLVRGIKNTWDPVDWVDTEITASSLRKIRRLINKELASRIDNSDP